MYGVEQRRADSIVLVSFTGHITMLVKKCHVHQLTVIMIVRTTFLKVNYKSVTLYSSQALTVQVFHIWEFMLEIMSSLTLDHQLVSQQQVYIIHTGQNTLTVSNVFINI